MIKEIFDIEPIQKNTLIIFLSLFCISFLQVFLFKPELLDRGAFINIGISLALTVSWIVLSLPSMVMLTMAVEWKDGNPKDSGKLIMENVILSSGIMMIGWILLLTYISYEFDFSFKTLIRMGILTSLFKFILWFIVNYIQNLKNRKKLKKELEK